MQQALNGFSDVKGSMVVVVALQMYVSARKEILAKENG